MWHSGARILMCSMAFVVRCSEDFALEKPKIQPFSFPKQHRVGKDITVSCFAMEGEPPLSFTWLNNDEKIESDAKFSVEHVAGKMSTLTVHEVSAADIGNYTCTVSNVAGSDRYTAALLVTGSKGVLRS